MITGLRRSVLFVPCDSESMIAKAAGLPADVLLLNLEDGVSASKKEGARAHAVRALRELEFGAREIVVRINSPESELGRLDLSAVAPRLPDGICVPKAESPAALQAVAEILGRIEAAEGAQAGIIRLHAMIETAAGVLGVRDIAASSPRMASLIFGSADYCADVRCSPGPDRWEMLFALQAIVAGARAAAIDAIDAPCFDIRDSDLLQREAAQARRFGFEGKSALHPGQLGTLNRAFAVTREELEWAERTMGELEDAEQRGRALSILEGRLIDNPHRDAAARILRRAGMERTLEDRETRRSS